MLERRGSCAVHDVPAVGGGDRLHYRSRDTEANQAVDAIREMGAEAVAIGDDLTDLTWCAPYSRGRSIRSGAVGRGSEPKPSEGAKVIRLPRVGGLHGRYTWRDAA